MQGEIIVAAFSLIGTCIGSWGGLKLMSYRIEQLEKKVEKHNSVVERTALLERDMKTVWHSIDEIREQVINR